MLRRALPLLVLAAATLTACDDPSNVGLGLVGGEGGEPIVYRTPLASLDLTDRDEPAGGTAFVLAGRADDPLLGTIEATGYVDFGDPQVVGSSSLSRFRTSTVTKAYLELPRAYLYGDTLSSVTFTLSPVSAEFSQIGAPSDTSFNVGSPFTSFTYNLPDSTVKVPLPDSWVAANDSTLRGSLFATAFHGFEIRATDGNAVIGFEPETIRLFATTAQDTVFFRGSKAVSATERLSAPNLPPGYVLLQDGFPNSYRVDLKLDTTQVRNGGLNRLALEVAYDSILTDQQTPPTFARPRLDLVELIGVNEEDDVLLTSGGNFFLRVTGSPDADGLIVFSSGPFTAFGQTLLLGKTSPVKSMLLQAPQGLGTLDAILVRAPGTDEAPTFVLTVVPTD